jgi:hypothetical protein
MRDIRLALYELGGEDMVEAFLFSALHARANCSWCRKGTHEPHHPHVTGNGWGFPPKPAATANYVRRSRGGAS